MFVARWSNPFNDTNNQICIKILYIDLCHLTTDILYSYKYKLTSISIINDLQMKLL